MSTVIEQPRNDVPIVADATLLAVPNMQDPAQKAEYLKRVRALRNEPPPAPVAPAEPELQEPLDASDSEDQDSQPDLPPEPSETEESSPDATLKPDVDTSNRVRLTADDLADYEIPVVDEDGNTVYLSYDEFNKTVGTYSKQNKKLRELAEREREVEAIKTNLLQEQAKVIQSSVNQEAKMAERYAWVQESIAFAHQHGVDEVQFEDGSKRKITQLIAEKTALENGYNQLMARRAQAQEAVNRAQQDFIAAQDKVLEARAPNTKKARADIAKFLEREGFTSQEANALAHAKAELLILLDKARRYDDAQRGVVKDKKVNTNTRVLKQPSRLAGRGTPVNNPAATRISELTALGTKATPDQLRELRRLQLQKK